MGYLIIRAFGKISVIIYVTRDKDKNNWSSALPNLLTNCHLSYQPTSGPPHMGQMVHPQHQTSESVAKPDTKRKPPCIGGMELVSLSCNPVFISAKSIGWGWCKLRIATKWYQFHTTDKCGFLFMPWITDQYTFVRYTKLVNKIVTAVAKVITFSIMTSSCKIHSVRHAAPPHPEQKLCAIFHDQNWNGYPVISMRRSVQSKQVVCRRCPALC